MGLFNHCINIAFDLPPTARYLNPIELIKLLLYTLFILKERGEYIKLLLEEDIHIEETLGKITYKDYDRKLQEIVSLVEENQSELTGIHNGKTYFIKVESIYYIESVDCLTFLYTEHDVFESKEKLYVIEEELGMNSFLRINKSTILNMAYLKYVTPLLNYRLEATLLNNDKLIINRHYMKNVKRYLNI